MSSTARLALAGALLLLAACRFPPDGILDGRCHDPAGRWSIAATPEFPGKVGGFARGAREGELSQFRGGSVYLPVWGVVVDERPREGAIAELAWVADEACLRVATALASGKDLELVHASRRELAGAPAELRVYATPARPPRGRDEDDLYREARHPSVVHALFATERGRTLVVFSLSVRARWDGERLRPSQRLTLEPRWRDFTGWIATFRAEPGEPDVHGGLE